MYQGHQFTTFWNLTSPIPILRYFEANSSIVSFHAYMVQYDSLTDEDFISFFL